MNLGLKTGVSALLGGILFAAGLGVAGMTEPANIIGFLDVTGQWNPQLLFVMGGAVMTYAILFRLVHKRKVPLFAKTFTSLPKNKIDLKLVLGAAIFGCGWGMTGLCPGPGIASLISGKSTAFIYVGSMILGMLIVLSFERYVSKKQV